MINITTNKTLNIILPNTNKALTKLLSDASPKELEQLSKGKDLKTLLNSFLKQSTTDTSADKLLLNLLKNNPTMKELASSTQEFRNFSNTLKNEKSLSDLKNTVDSFIRDIKDINKNSLENKINNSGILLESNIKNLKTPQNELKNLLLDITKQLEPTKLENVKNILTEIKSLLSSETFNNISNKDLLSNIKVDLQSLLDMSKKTASVTDKLLERLGSNLDKSMSPNDALFSKETKQTLEKIALLNRPENLQTQNRADKLFNNDLKSVLLKAQDEIASSNLTTKSDLLKHIDKLLLQVDYHQLLSHLSNSTSLYLPYSWDTLEDGKLEIKNQKDGRFFTDIELHLKEYGLLKLRLGLFENNQLNINITAESLELKRQLKESLPLLKKQLFEVGIIPKEIRFLEDKRSNYDEANEHIAVGFEVKA